MISLCPGQSCEEARVYYYDLLVGEEQQTIPAPIKDHVGRCEQCQQQIVHLEQLLASVEGEQQDPLDSLMTHLLSLHFGYLDQQVTCTVAKPFLPTLVDTALVLHVTTPITQHVATCSDCQRDVETVRALGLTSQQLYRFGQFLADRKDDDTIPFVAAWAERLAECHPHEMTAEQLKQVCLSPRGRDRVFTARAALLAYPHSSVPEKDCIPCDQVEPVDLFDYVLPYGTDPAADPNRKFKEVLATHVSQCEHCLSRIQTLHRLVFGIAERQDAKVVTVMRLVAEASPSAQGAMPVPENATPKQRRQPVVFPMVRAFAAVLLLVLGLFFLSRGPSATAVEYQEMQAALVGVTGLHLVMMDASTEEIRQEVVADIEHERWMMRQGSGTVFWDLPRGRHALLQGSVERREDHALSKAMVPGLRATLNSFFGVLPEAGHFPPGSQWNLVDSPTSSPEVEIRELRTPQQGLDGRERWHKRVYYLDASTHLPQRVEFYRATLDGEGTELKTVTTVTYPSSGELARDLAVFEGPEVPVTPGSPDRIE